MLVVRCSVFVACWFVFCCLLCVVSCVLVCSVLGLFMYVFISFVVSRCLCLLFVV